MTDLAAHLRHLADETEAYGLQDPMRQAADMLDAIDALHFDDQSPTGEYLPACGYCEELWPCKTHRILHSDVVDPYNRDNR